MRRLTLVLALLLPCIPAAAQMVLKIQVAPTYYTPMLDPIHVAGPFNNWFPADPNWILYPQADGSYSISLNGTPGAIVEYKYVRGQWPRVETQANGAFLPNRQVVFQNGTTHLDTVAAWEDLHGPHTAVGLTRILTMDYPIAQLGRTRRVWVYLPQDYYTSTVRYPVLYMHDAQNLFDEITTAFGTEWSVDESLKAVEDSGGVRAIVVAVDNGGMDRIDEYAPWVHPQYGGGQSDDYMAWLTGTLKPDIDARFRTMAGREWTGIMGSSLGGLLSLYGGLEHSAVFSRIGVFSPSFWFHDSCYTHAADHAAALPGPVRIYLLAGGQESTDMVPDMLRMRDTLLQAGVPPASLMTVVEQDGQHSEWFWAREFRPAFEWLFAGATPTSAASPAAAAPALLPSVFQSGVRLHWPGHEGDEVLVVLRSVEGQAVGAQALHAGELLELEDLPGGLLVAEIRCGEAIWRQRLVKLP